MAQRHQYIRHNVLPIDLVVDAMKRGELYLEVFGVKVGLSSTRIRTYTKGVACVCCHKTGDYFAIERFRCEKSWHLNLYHRKKNGAGDLMITSDHILAKSRGGSNLLENRQPMCIACNTIKGSHASVEEGRAFRSAAKATRETGTEEKIRNNITSCLSVITHCILKISEGSTEEKWHGIKKSKQKHLEVLKLRLQQLEEKQCQT